MKREVSGAMLVWRTRNVRKMRLVEVWCADYGLKQILKTFHIGMLYDTERRALERKLRHLLSAKSDTYNILTMCVACLKSAQSEHGITENKKQYEIV